MNRMRIALLGLVAICVAPPAVRGQTVFVPDTSRTIVVTGRGAAVGAPDSATAEVGVAVVDPDPKKAKGTADATVGRIVALARDLGLNERNLKTSPVNIEPRYDESNPARLRGYEVTRTVTATLADLSRLDAFLDGAVQAGANRNFEVTVMSSAEPDLKRAALASAIADAKDQAELAVKQLGAQLGPVRNVSLNRAGGIDTVSLARVVAVPGARFLPGAIRFSAEVTVTFSLAEPPR